MTKAASLTIAQFLQEKSAIIEERLKELVSGESAYQHELFDAARYSLLSGGKRLRPILTLAVVDALEGDSLLALNPACCLELIHTYSLIHDDLPCMDNDDFRRGKPTLHKVYTEGQAVLTGDFLLTYAFEVLANAPKLSAEQKISLIRILAESSGGNGMIAGQVMDLASFSQTLSLPELRQIHMKKTAALLTAAVEFGGIIAQADTSIMKSLQQFGQDIGLAFQIIDDILDVTSSQQKHGKKIGSDITNNKSTYVSILGIEGSRMVANQLFQSATAALALIPKDTSLLHALAEFLIQRHI